MKRNTIETICSHAGQGQPPGGPLVAPLVQSTTYCQGNSPPEHAYSRVSNPTVAELERTLGLLEDAPPAVCFGSGMAAETALLLTLLRAGDHVVCGRAVYGGTTRVLQQLFAGLGVESTFVDATHPALVAQAVRPETRLILAETPANPTLELTDITAIASIARNAGALLAVDNTFLTPLLQQPLDLGADASVYATTKFIEGHSVALGGAVVSRNGALLDRLRFIRKSTGGIQSPFNAWLTLQGIKTLPLRIERQSRSAETVARWLSAQPGVVRVLHPALDTFAQRELADRQHLGAHGAVVSFELEGGVDAGRAVLETVSLCRVVEHVGSVETLLTHPATMTHADVPPDQRARAGISDGLLRLSVGLERPEAIIEDLARAIGAAAREERAACLTSA